MYALTRAQLFTGLKFILPLGLGVYLLWHFYAAMDSSTKDVFFQAVREADYFWIIFSLLIGWASHLVRAQRWKYLLEPMELRPKFWHRYHALMVGYLVNLIIPRAGEATRAALLYRTDKIPFSKSFGTIIGERVFDVLMLGVIVLIALAMSFEDIFALKDLITQPPTDGEGGIPWGVIVLILLGIGMLVFVVLWTKVQKFRMKFMQFFREVMTGVFSLFRSKDPFWFIFYTLLMWVLYIVFFGICFWAFEETSDFPPGGVLIGFIAGTLGIMFTNGGIGAYPYLVGIVVTFYIGDHFDTQEAAQGMGKALGMIIWSSQTLGMIILGLISLILLPRNYKKEKNDALAESAA
jgi:uncharacterized membrane protein YbhN (UPF0104 family)